MRGLDERLTVAERVAWYRRRRGMSQEVLAGLVGRTEDWLSKVENGRANLDRLSVINRFAEALDVTLGDLIGAPQLVDWNADTKQRTVSSLRRAVMHYADLTPDDSEASAADTVELAVVDRQVADLWSAFQTARFGYVTHQAPRALAAARAMARHPEPGIRRHGCRALALMYQATATTLTKIGENQLSWICSDRGQAAAEEADDPDVTTSLVRSVAHSLLANGYYDDALAIVQRRLQHSTPSTSAGPSSLSLHGSLFLVAAMAAARADDAAEARRLLGHAERQASRLGRDGNHLWTAFGPTNVAIHRVSVAMEVGDPQIAADLGPRVVVDDMPTERRIRHRLEVARALNATNRGSQSLKILLDAERDAPEQVRYHFLSRHLVVSWLRNPRMRPTPELTGLARRLHVA